MTIKCWLLPVITFDTVQVHHNLKFTFSQILNFTQIHNFFLTTYCAKQKL